MRGNAAGPLLGAGGLLWMLWPFVNLLAAPPALGRAALAVPALLLLAGLTLYARAQKGNLGVGGALLAVAGGAIVLAGATAQLWLLPDEAGRPGGRTVLGIANAVGMLGLYLGGLLLGLDLRRRPGPADPAATVLLVAPPAALLLLGLVTLAGLPFGDLFAIHWPIGAALLALGRTVR
jgi:hypothetical protein